MPGEAFAVLLQVIMIDLVLAGDNAVVIGLAASGLPPEQLYTWLEWVQDDLRRVETRIEYLEAARSQLREQERLLGELLSSSGSFANNRR